MRLPNHKQAVVPETKLTGYLLAPSHPTGRAKAAFFARYGFGPECALALADTLRRHAASNDIVAAEKTPFGMRYIVESPLVALDGRFPRVRLVWFIGDVEACPRLVTAYPLPGGEEHERA